VALHVLLTSVLLRKNKIIITFQKIILARDYMCNSRTPQSVVIF
jgi:hypothetical protein